MTDLTILKFSFFSINSPSKSPAFIPFSRLYNQKYSTIMNFLNKMLASILFFITFNITK